MEVAFNALQDLLQTASASKRPTDNVALQQSLLPLQKALTGVANIKDKNRPSPLFFHLSTVADGIPALGWVAVEPTPVPYINEFKDAAQFYGNRVIKENKDKDKAHVEWVNAFVSLLSELGVYVKKWHTTGLTWNPKGGASRPPTAPPIPTQAQLDALADHKSPKPASSLFTEINKGNVTSGLRKVDKSEMTHKNPELRAASVVKGAAAPVAIANRSNALPPKLALEGNKWIVENQHSQSAVQVPVSEIRQVVYVYNCSNSTIIVKGKVGAIALDNCKKVGVVVESVVSTIDVVNCKSIQLQITGKAPTVVVDKTDGFQLYVSKESVGIEILSAKSSEMNVVILKGEGEDPIERPVAEQFKTTIVGDNLVTMAVEHSG